MIFQFITNRFSPSVTIRQANVVLIDEQPMTAVGGGLFEIELDDGVVLPLTDTVVNVGTLESFSALGFADGYLNPVFIGLAATTRYMLGRLHGDIWATYSASKQAQAIVAATQQINNLSFTHYLYNHDQPLEYPRTYEDCDCYPFGSCGNGRNPVFPNEIKLATAELALSLASKNTADPVDSELQKLRVISRRFSSVATAYASGPNGTTLAPPNLEAGIVSIAAWRFLQPFLKENSGVRINRVS